MSQGFTVWLCLIFHCSCWKQKKQEELDKILHECEWRFEIDGLPTIILIKDCSVFVKEVVQYYVTLQCKAMMDQLILGLQHSYQVLT